MNSNFRITSKMLINVKHVIFVTSFLFLLAITYSILKLHMEKILRISNSTARNVTFTLSIRMKWKDIFKPSICPLKSTSMYKSKTLLHATNVIIGVG